MNDIRIDLDENGRVEEMNIELNPENMKDSLRLVDSLTKQILEFNESLDSSDLSA